MAVFMGAFPVLAGKDGEPRKFAEETLGRRDEFDASHSDAALRRNRGCCRRAPRDRW